MLIYINISIQIKMNENEPIWPSSFKSIKNKNNLKNKKNAFVKTCKNFFMNYENKIYYNIELLILCLMEKYS